jgi:MFS family permease
MPDADAALPDAAPLEVAPLEVAPLDGAEPPDAPPARVTVREVLNPRLNRMLVGIGLSSIGNGLVMALMVVYLHQVRGLSLQAAGLVLTYQALFSLAVAPVVGWLVDRIGPQPVLVVGCAIMCVATAAFGFVTSLPQAIGAATLMAVGMAATWPPQMALLTRLTVPEHRQRVFGLQFMMLNLGIGLGGLAAAAVLDVSRPGTFTLMYLLDAGTFLIYLVAVASLRGVSGPEAHPPAAADAPGGYAAVLGDRKMRRYVLGALLLFTCGWGSIDAGIPPFMTTQAGLPVNAIGVVFAVNTFVIVAGQVWVLHRIEGRSRTRLLALVAVLWAGCWAFVAAAGVTTTTVAAVLIAIAVGVFAVGEMVMSPVGPSMINAFAPPHLRGRYNAVGGLIWGVAGALGPAFAGVVIGGGHGVVWAVSLAVGALLGGLVLRSLRTMVSAEEDGRAPVPAAQVRG